MAATIKQWKLEQGQQKTVKVSDTKKPAGAKKKYN